MLARKLIRGYVRTALDLLTRALARSVLRSFYREIRIVGAERIPLEAEARYGPLGVRIIPVHLAYQAKDRFRSRVCVLVGTPIDPAGVRAAHGEEPAAVRALTRQIAARLTGLAHVQPPWAR